MLTDAIRRFQRDEAGNVVILGALTLGVIASLAALALNYGSGAMGKQRFQNALDSAAMAAIYNINAGPVEATRIGIDAYGKQVGDGSTLGALEASSFTYGVWDDRTRSFVAGKPDKPLYYNAGQPVFYNAVQVTPPTGANQAYIDKVVPMAQGEASTDDSSRMLIGAKSLAYAPPMACLYTRNLGDDFHYGIFPADSRRAKVVPPPKKWEFNLVTASNSSWNTCGYISSAYWQDEGFRTANFGSPTIGVDAVTSNGSLTKSWAWLGKGVSNALWEPIAVPDDFVAPYRGAACDSVDKVIDTPDNVTLAPGVYCGGLDIRNAGATVTMLPGVYVMRGGDFKTAASLSKPTSTYSNTDPASGMPVGPKESDVNTTIVGRGVTILLQGSSYFTMMGGYLDLVAPTAAQNDKFSGLLIHAFDDQREYKMNYFQYTRLKLLGTVNTPWKKWFLFYSNVYSDCDILCMNIGNTALQNAYFSVLPGLFMPDRKILALHPKLRRPTYPMIRITADQEPQ